MTRLSFAAVFAAGWLAAVPFGGLSRAAGNPTVPADECPTPSSVPAPCPPAGVSCAPGLTIECPPPQVTFRTVAARLHPCAAPAPRPACVACTRPQFITMPAAAAPQFTFAAPPPPVMVFAAPQAVQMVQAAPQLVATQQFVAAPQFLAPQAVVGQQFVAAPQTIAVQQVAAPQFVVAPQTAVVQAAPQFVTAPQAAQSQAVTQSTCPEFDLQAALAMLVRARQGAASQAAGSQAARPAGANPAASAQAAGGGDELAVQLKRIEDRLAAAERATLDNSANIEVCVKALTRILDQLGQTAAPPVAPKK